ncbi:MAG: type II secretion system F family protein [Lachnospiraceae bacterium]|nr:type II secretion system F family protein [Lachnospiraceae bacterium]
MSIKKIISRKIEQLKERVKRIKKRSIYCIVAGIIFAILSLITNDKSIYVRPNEIERSSYGTQKTPYFINVDVENLAKNMEFSVSVSSKKYTKEEADEVFSKKIETLKVGILNENESLEKVNSKLNFKTDLGDGIKASYVFEPKKIDEYYDKYKKRSKKSTKSEISISESTPSIATKSDISDFKYYVEYQNVIDGSGNVSNENFKITEFCTGYIVVQLSTEIKGKEGSYKSEKYMLPVRVVSRELSPIESFKVAFKKEVVSSDKETIDEDTIKLPEVINDFKVIYKEKKNLGFLLMPIFGLLVAILLDARDKEQEKEKQKRRVRLLEIDFAQIISKILLYVSSGMTIRNSFVRLAEQYQKNKKDDKNYEPHAAYEELIVVKNKLTSGYSEINAYEEMAKNINMRVYTRFLNIIIQSIKNGNKDLKNILNMEVQDALYERKQNAKKLGEEASTKLVLPLMMMLSIIMVVIMVPAFMGM